MSRFANGLGDLAGHDVARWRRATGGDHARGVRAINTQVSAGWAGRTVTAARLMARGCRRVFARVVHPSFHPDPGQSHAIEPNPAVRRP